LTPLSQPPLISIITPSYNQADFLAQTIESVLAQEYPRLEYYVYDGGSTDGSQVVIRQYAERLTGWVSEIDHGQADAINKGFRKSTGEILAWLNSDDFYQPGALARVAQAFQEHPEAGLIYGNVLSVDETGTPFHLQAFQPYTLEDLMSFRIISQPGVFFRRSLLERAGLLDESYHLLLDHQLWLRMARLAPMVYIPETLAAARYHPAAKNRARAAGFGAEALRIADWMESDPAFAEPFAGNRRRIRAGALRLDAYYLLEGGSPGRSLRAYGKAFAQHPPTALADWRRILFAGISLIGLGQARAWIDRWRRSRLGGRPLS
jgi:glycosyltransferase involved in cell wall biosynthesis